MKKTLAIVGGICVALLAALFIAVSSIDANAYKDDLVRLVETRTGRDLQINGAIDLTVSLSPSIMVDDVRLGNAAWGSSPEMLSIQRLELEVALLPLLTGDVRIDRLALFSPELLLETTAEGLGNWVPDVAPDGTSPSTTDQGSSGLFSIEEIEVRNAHVTYRDGRSEQIDIVTIEEILIVPGAGDAPATVDIQADYNGIPVKLTGAVGTADRFLGNRSYPLDLSARFGGASLSVSGVIARPLQGAGMDLALTLRADSLADLSAGTDNTLPPVGPVDLSGQLVDTDLGYSLTGLSLRVGESDISGEVTLLPSDRLRVSARLFANRLDLADLGRGADGAKARRGKLFPATPLPIRTLSRFDADVTVDVKELALGSVVLENTKAHLALDGGEFVIDPLTSTVAGGALDSTLRVQGRDDAATVALDLDLEGFLPGRIPAFSDLVEEARTDLSIEVTGHGRSIAAIMAGLNGDFLAISGPGVLKNRSSNSATSDLIVSAYRKLNPTAGDDETNRMECAVVKFDIRDGIAATDRGIALATRKMNVVGSGLVNFKTEGLDIGFTPEAREGVGISTAQLAELVRLQGTLVEPKAGLDTRATLMTGVSAGAAIATSGLSILAQGLYDRLTADDDPCATALASDPGMTRTDKSTSEKAADKVKEVGESIKETFRGLFGN